MYGIKSSKIAATMVKQLQQCWEATHPEKPATKAKSKAKAAAMRKKKTTTTQSESSEEESLAHQAAAGKKKRATKKIDKPAALTLDQLNAEFQKIMLEPDNYIKVLRYEVGW